jgi:hypothetical protein
MSSPKLPDHLVSLTNDGWAVWRWIAVRSAGFPTAHVLAFADTECAALADAYLAQEAAAQNERKVATQYFWQKLKEANPQERAFIRKSLRQLEKGRVPVESALEGAEVPFSQFRQTIERAAQLKAEFQQKFHATVLQNTQTLQMIASDARFREAILWQNRGALQGGINHLLRTSGQPSRRTSRHRQNEALLAFYLQRYCMKNDTIGFFGPVAWAQVEDQEPSLHLQTGDSFLAERNVYFELWGMDVLAGVLAQNEALRPWCSPRRFPLLNVEALSVQRPLASAIRLTPAQAAVLKGCEGEWTAKQLASRLVKDPESGLKTEAEVYEILEYLHAQRWLEWRFEIPAEGLYPERNLRQSLERIEDTQLRQAALSDLDQLELARQRVAQAAGDADKLDQALQALELTFMRLTGTDPTRQAGQVYAGRTLVYEDCCRNLTLHLSPTIIASLGPPLGLLLTSARWFSFMVAKIYRKACREIYADLAQKTGCPVIDFASFWLHLQPVLFGENKRLIRGLERELQKRWATLFKFDVQPAHVHYTTQALAATVQDVFNAPRPGWQAACYHSPDLMLAAPSLAAIQQGDYQWVLGELHAAANTLTSAFWLAQHPARQDLADAWEADLPFPQVRLVPSREAVTPRRAPALIKENDYRLIVANDACGVPPSQALLAGALVVEEFNGELIVRRREGTPHFEIIEFLGDLLSLAGLHHFDFLPPLPHIPRLSIDQLVVYRETWRFTAEQVSFAFQKDESERFLEARRWAGQHRLPRFIFVKTPTEEKPFCVDVASPISIDLLARAIRRSVFEPITEVTLKVTEMLPDPSQTWLRDSLGQTYTSELRMVVVDCSCSSNGKA